MNFLLKIVDGPMKGAEIALVAGTRVKVGSSDSCDVVIADASLPAVAFELDVAADSVMMITPDGAQRPMKPLEVCDFGTTGVAIGPADEPWGQLTRQASEPAPAEEPAEAASPEPAAPESEPKADEPTAAEKPAEEQSKGKGGCLGCLLPALMVLMLLATVAFLLWNFWPPARQFVSGLRGDDVQGGQGGPEQVEVVETVSLSDLAAQHGLQYSEDDGVPTIKGNLKRRTERMAIRALAKSENPLCKLDVTDDETMLANSKELVFAYTEGSIKVLAATNRVISLGGYAPSPDALARTIRVLNEDISGIDNVDTSNVTVGGIAPAEVAGTAFVQGGAASAPAASAGSGVARPFAPKGPSTPRFNIAGILTVPYPCVVLQSGHRIMEGAQIGTATLVKIEADKLEMKEGDRTFEWTP